MAIALAPRWESKLSLTVMSLTCQDPFSCTMRAACFANQSVTCSPRLVYMPILCGTGIHGAEEFFSTPRETNMDLSRAIDRSHRSLCSQFLAVERFFTSLREHLVNSRCPTRVSSMFRTDGASSPGSRVANDRGRLGSMGTYGGTVLGGTTPGGLPLNAPTPILLKCWVRSSTERAWRTRATVRTTAAASSSSEPKFLDRPFSSPLCTSVNVLSPKLEIAPKNRPLKLPVLTSILSSMPPAVFDGSILMRTVSPRISRTAAFTAVFSESLSYRKESLERHRARIELHIKLSRLKLFIVRGFTVLVTVPSIAGM
mmetsp:Transcript_7033/g.21416  ORF Transcript_7033/g.21416 Transcript_7033/m.21416 type:complete len:313 (-) Transcript_7033:1458-2396(-)